jgi:hypothetical protein
MLTVQIPKHFESEIEEYKIEKARSRKYKKHKIKKLKIFNKTKLINLKIMFVEDSILQFSACRKTSVTTCS